MAANKALRRLVKRIEELKKQVRGMEEQYQENEYYYENRMQEIRASAESIARDAEYQRREAEEELRNKEYKAHDLARKLQSARDRGDVYDCDRLDVTGTGFPTEEIRCKPNEEEQGRFLSKPIDWNELKCLLATLSGLGKVQNKV